MTLWRLLKRESPVKPEYIAPLLRLLTSSEFENLVLVGSRLRSLGLIEDDGTMDYGLVLEVVSMGTASWWLRCNMV